MISDLVTLAAAGILGLAGAYIGKDTPSKKIQCIKSYGDCLTQRKDDIVCERILEVCEMDKPGNIKAKDILEINKLNGDTLQAGFNI